MSEETATNDAPRGTAANQSSAANAVDPAERLAELRNLAFSNFVANINLAQQNAVSNQQAMDQLGMSVVGKLVNFILASDVEQSLSPSPNIGDNGTPQIPDLTAAQAESAPEAGNSLGYSSAIEEMERANRVFNANLEQLNVIQRRQAYFQIQMAAIAKCLATLLSIDGSAPDAAERQKGYRELLDSLLEQVRPEIEEVKQP